MTGQVEIRVPCVLTQEEAEADGRVRQRKEAQALHQVLAAKERNGQGRMEAGPFARESYVRVTGLDRAPS